MRGTLAPRAGANVGERQASDHRPDPRKGDTELRGIDYVVKRALFAIATYAIWRILHSPIGMVFRAFDAAGLQIRSRTSYSVGGGFVVDEGAQPFARRGKRSSPIRLRQPSWRSSPGRTGLQYICAVIAAISRTAMFDGCAKR